MPDFELSVTICSWNTLAELEECLCSLEAALQETCFEVIVVDNNSEDGSPEMVERRFPWVRLYRMGQNLGFTGGHNFALAQRHAASALLLNSDAAVRPGALRALADFSRSRPDVGIVGPKLVNPDGSLQFSCRRFPNPTAALFRNTPLGRMFPNNHFTRDYLMSDWPHDQPRDVDWVSGAAMFVSGEMMARVGLMDPEYFMFCEDVDWCYRCHEAGLKVVYLPGAVVTHAIGRSTDKAPNRMIDRFHRSMFRFYRRNMLPKLPWPVRPFAYVGAASALTARAALFIAKNRLDDWRRRHERS
ncbi:MAG: glycosyltransferase family 2 protein [Fimbriimonas ginsengisoli]|uniref:Glycosyltransferase family 2 protein n=1 Tax=Fimbriimonas ginsengisoli TaxID=1005039 RepID=A0A931PWN4_FIMGI|nr:glycosyltransferase family 2 protein [Fimbriimonas ginsengisoli]MBI3722082.1 glycosyltransferase family 2 protein [Fimbriimonas ginsengisoli]